MFSKFVSRMNEFLDLEAYGEGYADYGLDLAYDYLAEKEPGDIRLERDGILAGEDAALDFLKTRVFPSARSQDFKDLPNLRLEKSLRGEPQLEEDFSETLEAMERMEASDDILYRALGSRLGISVEESRELLDARVREARLQELRGPALHRALIRRFLRRLDRMVDEIQKAALLELPSDGVPMHLKILISDAHEAFLLGQEVSCAVLCGTALEEALKFRLGDRFDHDPKDRGQQERRGIIARGIAIAVDEGIFGAVEEIAAKDVNAMRNNATHDPGNYLITPDRRKRDLLLNTRFAIAQLFAGS